MSGSEVTGITKQERVCSSNLCLRSFRKTIIIFVRFEVLTAACIWTRPSSGLLCCVKGKAVPLRSIEAHLGDRRYSSCSFLTSVLEGGEWSASRPGGALPPGKEPPVPTVQEAGRAPEPVWTQGLKEKSSASVGDRKPAVQYVVSHYTEWATPAHPGRVKVRI
jgi:hypothetical protein